MAAGLTLALAAPARAELRIGELEVFLNAHEVTVHAVLLGALPEAFHEGLRSGIPAQVRFTVELWRYKRYWPDQLLATKVVERNLAYNVVTKEFRVGSIRGEQRRVFTTRDLRDAQRILGEVRDLKLTPATALEPSALVYVRVNAEAALNGENTFLARMAGTAEQVLRRSDYRALPGVQ